MGNTNLSIDMITRRSLMVLHQKATFLKSINRQYDESFAKSGAKIGDELRIRLPRQYTVRTGKVADIQDSEQKKTTLTVATQKGIDLKFGAVEMTMDIDDYSKEIIEPAMSTLAAVIEADVLQSVTKKVYNLVGTPGTTPATMLVWGQARQKLNENLAPPSDRNAHMDSATMAAMTNAYSTLFAPNGDLSKQYKEGVISRTSGLDWYENESILNHTTGSRDNTTPLTNAVTAQTGTSLIINDLDADVTIKAGDVFTIADVYQVHPETKQAYGHLQQFVVNADVTADGSGNATLSISPEIIVTGAYQNVNTGAANDKAITFVGSASTAYGQNLVYHKDAFTFVSADIEMPMAGVKAHREQYENLSMIVTQGFDIINFDNIMRVDVLYGFLATRAALACRVTK